MVDHAPGGHDLPGKGTAKCGTRLSPQAAKSSSPKHQLPVWEKLRYLDRGLSFRAAH
jgi:hypothetical protein